MPDMLLLVRRIHFVDQPSSDSITDQDEIHNQTVKQAP